MKIIVRTQRIELNHGAEMAWISFKDEKTGIEFEVCAPKEGVKLE